MNMKLLSGLAVVLALTSAMTFLGVYAKSLHKASPVSASQTQVLNDAAQASVPALASSSSGSVATSVKVLGDVTRTSVTVAK